MSHRIATVRAMLASAEDTLRDLTQQVAAQERQVRRLRQELATMLSPLPVGTVIDACRWGGRTQRYQVTHHGLCGFDNEGAIPWVVPVNKDGSLRQNERGGRWLYESDTYTIVSRPAPEEPPSEDPL